MTGESEAGLRARRAAALAVLDEADAVLADWSCPRTAECCHFASTGKEPWLTEVEWRIVLAELGRQGRRVPAMPPDRTCPFLDDAEGRCTIYAARPLGCRTFYCHRGTGPKKARRGLADLPRRLEVLSDDPDADGRPLAAWINRARRGLPITSR
jgi:hypothetical protein